MREMIRTGVCLAAAIVVLAARVGASSPTAPGVPEIGPGSISAGMALLAGGVLMLRARRSK